MIQSNIYRIRMTNHVKLGYIFSRFIPIQIHLFERKIDARNQ